MKLRYEEGEKICTVLMVMAAAAEWVPVLA